EPTRSASATRPSARVASRMVTRAHSTVADWRPIASRRCQSVPVAVHQARTASAATRRKRTSRTRLTRAMGSVSGFEPRGNEEGEQDADDEDAGDDERARAEDMRAAGERGGERGAQGEHSRAPLTPTLSPRRAGRGSYRAGGAGGVLGGRRRILARRAA